MYLVALLSQDPQVVAALAAFSDPRFLIHSIGEARALAKVLAALEPLEFAGALVIGPNYQQQALSQMQRSSLEARECDMVDTVTVTPAGLVGDYLLGKALGQVLRAEGWDPRQARAVVLGGSAEAKVLARELASLGVSHLTLLAQDRPSAERSLPHLPASTGSEARALSEPGASLLVEQADILVRADARLELDPALLGPHLSVVDLAPSSLSTLRKQALKVGAKTLGLRDLQAYFVSTALGHILGSPLEVDPFLSLFHAGS